MHEVIFEEAIEQIRAKDPRYHRDAYHFVRQALEHTKQAISKQSKDPVLHVTGQELLDGIRRFALDLFGPMTMAVLEEWGITKCEDFGEIVFHMVDSGLLAKTDKDSHADFQGGYDFFEAFRKPFLPSNRLSEPADKSPADEGPQQARPSHS